MPGRPAPSIARRANNSHCPWSGSQACLSTVNLPHCKLEFRVAITRRPQFSCFDSMFQFHRAARATSGQSWSETFRSSRRPTRAPSLGRRAKIRLPSSSARGQVRLCAHHRFRESSFEKIFSLTARFSVALSQPARPSLKRFAYSQVQCNKPLKLIGNTSKSIFPISHPNSLPSETKSKLRKQHHLSKPSR